MKPLTAYQPGLVAAIILSTSLPLAAQKEWNVNDGTWSTAGNWSPSGAPGTAATSANDVNFGVTANSSASSIQVDINNAARVRVLRTGAGKTVRLSLDGGSSLTTNSASGWQIGGSYGTGSGASHLTLQGPASGTANVYLHSLQIAAASDAADGNSFTMTGKGLNVTTLTDSAGAQSVIGRWSNGNKLVVSDGANATLFAMYVANTTSSGNAYRDNSVIVDGATLALTGGSGNLGLLIGQAQSGTGGDSYNTGLQHNTVTVTNGGTLHMSTGNQGNTPGAVTVGNAKNAHSNSLHVTDNGTMLLDAENRLIVGNSAATNRGGNKVRVDEGGRFITNGNIFIYSYTKTGQNDGENELVIARGGTLSSSAAISTAGLLRLEEGGALKGETPTGTASALAVTVEENGRFEAAGSGLGTDVTTTVLRGGRFVVDGAGSTAAVGVDLDSTLQFTDSGSILGLNLYGNGEVGEIRLGLESSLVFAVGTQLELNLMGGYIPQFGDEWTLFTGETSNIVGDLDFSMLPDLGGSLWWDTSNLNAAGQWRVAVIPENSSTALLALAGGVLALNFARRSRSGC